MKLSRNKKKIGILITNNTRGGIAKLSAMMANDIANRNNNITEDIVGIINETLK